MHEFLFFYIFITLHCSPGYTLHCVKNLANNQHVETKVNVFLRSKETMVASIATHYENEQYSTFVERTLAATEMSRGTLPSIRKKAERD